MGQPGDWRQPTGDPDRPFSDIIQAHWVSLTKDNSLVGRISTIDPEQLELQPAESLQVAFVQNGMVMSTGTTDQAGRFSATDLRPRVYSLIAPGANGFMAYSLSVLPFRANGQDEVQRDGPPRRAVGDLGDDAYIPVDLRRVESSLTIDAAAVPPTFKTIGRLVRIYYPNFRKSAFGENAYQNAVNRDRANKLPGWNDEAGPHGRLDMKTALVSKTKAAKSAAIRTYRIPLRPDGRLIGRLHAIQRDTGRPKMVRSLNVFIIQNDRELAQVSVDRYGVFEVNGLSPGAYSLVAAGQDGFGAVGFQLAKSAEGLQSGGYQQGLFRHQLASTSPGFWLAFRQQLLPTWAPLPIRTSPLCVSVIDDIFDTQMALRSDDLGRRGAAVQMLATGPVPPASGPPLTTEPAPANFAGGGGGGGGGGFGGGGLAAGIFTAVAVPLALANDDAPIRVPVSLSSPDVTSQ